MCFRGSYHRLCLIGQGHDRFCLCRYHIGESMLPSVSQFLKLIEADGIVAAHGFVPKVIRGIPHLDHPYLYFYSLELLSS